MHTFVLMVAEKLGISEEEVFRRASKDEDETQYHLKEYRISFKVPQKVLDYCVAILES